MSHKRDHQEEEVEKIYQKKTQLEHILLRPDTYIGSIEHLQQQLWVYDQEQEKIVFKQINYVPGLYKIFDEILVNAADNFQKDKTMNLIKVEINQKDNRISVWNNGKGIPVQIHKEHNCYVPEMIFGHLLTSSNYNDNVKKVTGGRNGYGAKLTNIFSKKFTVETGDMKNKKIFKQVFKNNMSEKMTPEIKPNEKEQEYTCITFEPDLAKFNMTELDDDIVSLMTKRVYDLAGVTPQNVKVKLNGKSVEVKNFHSYVDLYLETDENRSLPKIIEKTTSDRWEVVCSLSDGQFQQVSFVNSICTIKGGTHVNYLADQIVNKIMTVLQKKEKSIQIKAHQVKANLWLFVNSLIENPAFDSQTKETLTTKPQNFGSECELSDKFMKEILNSGVIESILTVAKAKEEAKMAKTLGPGKKKAKLFGIPKLEDANMAGTRNAEECTIILTEGDSAKSLAMAGIEIVGRDKFGVFPLRGKFLNVRDANNKKIMENPEIQNLIKILGLQIGKRYEDTKNLRYGSIMIMTDQDHDGSHIKGLLINFIHHFWPSLVEMNGFLKEFVTPILKVTKGNDVKSFFTIPEYESWAHGKNLKGYKIKYYKGLGTSTSKEAKEYFSEINTHEIEFEYIDRDDDEVIDLAFNGKLADKRKDWLASYDSSHYVDHSVSHLRYKDFVNKELILFSIADCQRSIPSLCDGLKPGQRKILFACFKRNLKQEIKVAQLAGYVAEHSAYHHGEVSLCSTIVTMAQNFVGSNNINLLLPNGQFGTRNQGGKEAASPRYIFTMLNNVTRYLFHLDDDNVLNYLEEEGQSIEPDYYLPIIPMSLVNGAEGIGTGWSTYIPGYNPRDIVANLKRMMNNEEQVEMHPWFKGFQGIIEENGKGYNVKGVYNVLDDDELEITELPIGKWTRDYKTFLEEMAQKEEIEEIREYHQENRVHFKLKVPKLQEIIQKEGIEKKFKLATTLSINNFVLFNYRGQIQRYASAQEIILEFFDLRKELYEKRKEFMLSKLRKEFEILANKVRFILGVINEEIRINKVKRQLIVKTLKEMGFKTMSELNLILNERKKETVISSQIKEEGEEQEDSLNDTTVLAPGEISPKEYDYLLTMPMWSLSEEKVEELQRQMREKKKEYDNLEAKHIYEIWTTDLDNFLHALDEYEQQEEQDRLAHGSVNNEGKKKRKKNAGGAAKQKKKGTDITSPQQMKKKEGVNAGKKNNSGQKQNKAQGQISQFLPPQPKQPKKKVEIANEEEDEELPLLERLKRKNEKNQGSQGVHLATTSVTSGMTQSEKEAFTLGSRKRKNSVTSSSIQSQAESNKENKNMNQRKHQEEQKQINNGSGKQKRRVLNDEDDDFELQVQRDSHQVKSIVAQPLQKRTVQQRAMKPVKYFQDSDSNEDSFSDFDGIGMKADDDSI